MHAPYRPAAAVPSAGGRRGGENRPVEMVERLRAWSYRRQHLGGAATSPAAALHAVVAVYATHPTTPLALWARTRAFTPAGYRRLDGARAALRIPAMRGTLFLVPAEHAARVFAAVRPPASRVRASLRRHGIGEDEYEALAGRLLAAAGEPRRAAELRAAAGIDGTALGTVLRCLRYDGRMVALGGDSLSAAGHRYVSTASWAPGALDGGGSAPAALSWLAGAYLHGYGPARVEDFAWWAGVARRAAAAALDGHDTVDVGGGLLLPVADEAAFGRARRPRGAVDLLPKWDAYTMGHAPDGRARLVHPDVQAAVYTPLGTGLAGDGNPVVLVDGQVAGTWTFTVKEGGAVQPFDTLGPAVRRRVGDRLAEVAALLGR